MPNPGLCTEEEVSELVHRFYDTVRRDALLGPIFQRHVADWDAHMPKMVDFWSSALRGTSRFRGSPMPKHVALPGLNKELFQHWLALFRQTTRQLQNKPMAERASDLAGRIAESLWYGYEMSHNPDHLPGAM